MLINSPIDQLRAQGFSSLDIEPFSSRIAAVLVLLYQQPESGHLRVLLTTRSKSLRTHPGQTALPGGRKDESDEDLIYTAFREANEEVGLPIPEQYNRSGDPAVPTTSSIKVLCTLEPHLSLHRLVVTPVVALLEDPTVLDTLRPAEDEVSRIFTHPLEAILDPSLIIGMNEPLVEKGSEDWIYEEDLHHWEDDSVPLLHDTSYRYHRFRGSGSPVTGLTADILIKVAEAAYRPRTTTYEPYAPDQVVGYEFVLMILKEKDLQSKVS